MTGPAGQPASRRSTRERQARATAEKKKGTDMGPRWQWIVQGHANRRAVGGMFGGDTLGASLNGKP